MTVRNVFVDFYSRKDRPDSLTVLIHLHGYRCECLQSKLQGPLTQSHRKTFHTGLSVNLYLYPPSKSPKGCTRQRLQLLEE